MKRSKKIGILCGILACVSLAAFGVSRYEKEKEIIKNSDEIIMKIDDQAVNVLSWECSTGTFGFHRDENGNWLYDEDKDFPVDAEKIKGLLEPFEEFGVSFIIESVEDFGQYGLDAPVCTIHMETEENQYEVKLGNYSAMDSQRYVSIGDGNAYLVKTDPLDRFEIDINDVILHDEIPEFSDVKQVVFSGGESERIVYEEDSRNSYCPEDVYFLERGEKLLPLDTVRVQEYLNTVENLNLKDYVNYKASEGDLAAYGLDSPELTMTVDYTDKTFVIHIGRDPETVKKEEAEAAKETEEDENGENTRYAGEDGEEDQVTAYARVGDSRIIYGLTTNQYKKLKAMTYDSLRHQELFWADLSEVYQIDVVLEGTGYSITSQKKDGERTCYYQEEEVNMDDMKSAIKGLRADRFTDRAPEQKEEISLTLYLDNDDYPEIRIQFYRYDGNDCIAVVDGEPVALVERSRVVDLMEAVNKLVL